MCRSVRVAMEVLILWDNVESALAAIAALGGEQVLAANAPADLVAALAKWGFEAEMELPRGDVWIEVFRGRCWQSQERLFAALAPYARGHVEVLALDDARWGYQLGDGLPAQDYAA